MAKEKVRGKWNTVIIIILILAILSFIISGIVSMFMGVEFEEGNVAKIGIKGIIMTEDVRFLGQEVVDSPSVVKFIESAGKNPKIKAIILEINSPGGSPVATEEIANAIESVDKPTVAWIREVGASGGYWIATSADKIVASRMSVTGSIGVIASYMQFSGLLRDYNVTYERLVAGDLKDIGSPLKPLGVKERRLLQKQIDSLHDYFIEEVAENRGLSKDEVRKLGTGMIYLGKEAKELGLVDVLGGFKEAKEIIEKEINETVEVVEYKEEKGFFDLLSEVRSEQSFFMGKGIGSSLVESRDVIKVWT